MAIDEVPWSAFYSCMSPATYRRCFWIVPNNRSEDVVIVECAGDTVFDIDQALIELFGRLGAI